MIAAASGRAVGLVIVLLGLIGGVSYEVLDWRASPAPLPMPSTPTGFMPAAKTDAAASANRLTAWRDEILSRPLFSRDRKPVQGTAQRVSGLSRLTGIIFSGAHRIAIFAGQSGGRSIVAEEGSRIGAYDVRAISGSSVTVAGAEGTTVLRPIFDATSSAGPKAAPGARPPQPTVRTAIASERP